MDTTLLYVFMALSAILLFMTGFSVGVNCLKLTKAGNVLFVVSTLGAVFFIFYMFHVVPKGGRAPWYISEVIVIIYSIFCGMVIGIFIHQKRAKAKPTQPQSIR
ncbi:MAG: hypothetical protein AAB787_01960 [Patescibacteria group bacterium]